jgi:hypothetical protein
MEMAMKVFNGPTAAHQAMPGQQVTIDCNPTPQAKILQ